ncbi:glycosyltransferase family 2 protein [Tenacibaculum sp. 190524A05c]|uniref:glycosyltransferase family 2 protein n=1 Tax=Tenacibaculum platacis TaxID=3137852 RepID=UPI0032B29B49
MIDQKPIISIVIPTRNRQKYALSCVKSILSIPDDRLEIVLHDNSLDNSLEYSIQELRDSRVKYYYNDSEMSTVHNFDYGMDYATGEYICYIGDDDCVTKDIVKISEWALKQNLDALIGTYLVNYNWPKKDKSSSFTIYPFNSKIKKVNVKSELTDFLQKGGVYYLKHDLPRVYHGIVRKQCFDKVKDKLGYYFGGLTPDIFASISVSCVAQNVMKIDYPLTVAGSSSESDQTHRTDKARNTKLKDAPHFRGRGEYTWSEIIPDVYSGETIWAESSIKALEEMGCSGIIKANLNKINLLATILKANPHQFEEVYNYAERKSLDKEYSSLKVKVSWKIYAMKINDFLSKVKNRFMKLIFAQKTIRVFDLENIELAVDYLENYLEKRKPKFLK